MRVWLEGYNQATPANKEPALKAFLLEVLTAMKEGPRLYFARIIGAATEARMSEHARGAVLRDGGWLTAAQIAERAGFSSPDEPDKWKKDGLIFTIPHDNVDYFPRCGLAPTTFRPIKALAPVLAVFQGEKDGWGLAYWFASASSFLGGRRPQDLLLTEPDEVIAAAEDEMVGVAHG